MTKNIFLIAVLMGLMLATASAALTFGAPAVDPYCPANGEKTLAISEQTTTDYTTFEFVGSHYLDGESVPLLVQKTLSTDNFKFFIYSDALTIDTTKARACGSTAAHTKVDLLGSVLITSASSLLYACLYDSASIGDITIQKLLPSGTHQPKPYFVDGNKIHAIYNDGTDSKVCTYTVTGTADLACTDITGTIAATTLSTASGNQKYLFHSGDKKFYKNSAGAAWADDSANLPVTVTQFAKIFTLRNSILVVDILDTATLKTTQLKKVVAETPTTIASSVSSTSPIKYFTDGYNNFMQINSDQLVWVTISSTNTVFQTIIPESSLSGTDTSLILNVGLSKAKAVVLYSNKVEYWRHTATDNVQNYFSKSFTAGDIIQPTTGTKQYKLALSCLCETIDRMACFSATLNCVILRKAGGACVKTTFAALY